MNKGNTEIYSNLLLTHIHNLNTNGKFKVCKATTKYLAKAIGKSERQTYRYLKFLKETGKIENVTSKLRKNVTTGKLYKVRKITVTCVKPHNSDQILAIYFDRNFDLPTKHKLIKDLVLNSKPFDYIVKNYVLNASPKVADAIISNINADAGTVEIPANFDFRFKAMGWTKEIQDKLENDRKVCEAEESGDDERKFNRELELDAKDLLRVIYDNQTALRGSSNLEILANYSIDSYRKIEQELYEYESDSEREEKVRNLAKNATVEGNTYYITINLAGKVPHKIRLFDYVLWGKDSAFFELFKSLVVVND